MSFYGDMTEAELDQVVTLAEDGDPVAQRFIDWVFREVLPAIDGADGANGAGRNRDEVAALSRA